ncbi:stage III sporulation protein AF [Gracilibacillus timonensis]|uniref:stage III sporulation protein AF n=1 Tax=Gracilibacillus timonensis TaxID=1816696 RepID=UPI0021CC3C60|nr:stage III sporulation protein AF [Gracilibacillus timonensis]
MEFLTSWILQIIIYMLLAMVVHLLLPNSQLKQYARLVIGLLLILVILQPLLALLDIDIPTMSDEMMQITEGSVDEQLIESQVDKQKSEIEEVQTAYILDEMVVQMQYVAEEELIETYAYQMDDLDVTWNNPQQIEDYKPEYIQATLAKHEDQTSPIDEVKIQVTDPPEKPTSEPDNSEEIQAFLAEKWGVDQDMITVIWKEE